MKNFKRITKRGLSLFIALVMCMSVMSLTAFAEDDVTGEPEIVAEQVTEPAEVETQDPVEVVEPVEDEEPAEDPTPVEDEAPVEEPAEIEEPVETEEPVEDAEPVEDEAPAETEEPAEAEEPVVEATIGQLVDVSINSIGSIQGGNFVMDLLATLLVSDCTLTLTADAAMSWSVAPHSANELYVSSVAEDGSVKLNFDIIANGVDLNGSDYALTLTANADQTTWTGSFGAGFAGATLAELAEMLGDRNVYLAADVMNGSSEARRFLVNHYNDTVSLALCVPNAAIYTMTYQVDTTVTSTMELAAGMTIPQITPALTTGQTFDGWYINSNTDDEANKVTGDVAISADTTWYAKITSEPEQPDTLAGELDAKAKLLHIKNKTDWATFAARSGEITSEQRVILETNIDCGGATYASLTFAGSFDGGGHTISNAKFTKVSTTYTGSDEKITCCGMFAVIRSNQIVANLNLVNITANDLNADYSGPLAGAVDGGYIQTYPLVQNVQVSGSKIGGRSAGGIAGYARSASIRFCSSKNTTINGLANGGGIIGMNSSQSKVDNCFSTCTPTALTFMNGTVGGVVAKNLRSGRVEYCWSTAAKMEVVGKNDSASSEFCLVMTSTTTPETFFDEYHFSEKDWLFEQLDTDFDPDAVYLEF